MASDDGNNDIDNGDINSPQTTTRTTTSEKNDEADSRFNIIWLAIILLLAIGVTAIVLPFVLDYGDDDDGGRSTDDVVVPTMAPGPTTPTAPSSPTSAPTIGVPPSEAPTSLRFGQFLEVFLIPIFGEEPFEDPNSAQYRAADFIANEDEYVSELVSENQLLDRYALVTFYFATGGDESWKSCHLDDENCANRWLVGDHCEWYGLACDDDGFIQSIIVGDAESTDNGLNGYLPEEMWTLDNLETLAIVGNEIGGTLPSTFGSTLENMKTLILQNNKLSGSIPIDYLIKSPLEMVLLGKNQLTGDIPIYLGNATAVKSLDLGNNQLDGFIPAEIGDFQSLTSLILASNDLTGIVPDELYTLVNLQSLHIGGNAGVSGSLSPSIRNLELLKELSVGQTQMSGSLPDELLQLQNIQEIDLREAVFEGFLSAAFGGLGGTLEVLRLDNNQFSGTIPTTLSQLTKLSILNTHGNDLTGSIAPGICALNQTTLVELTADCEAVNCPCCTQCF